MPARQRLARRASIAVLPVFAALGVPLAGCVNAQQSNHPPEPGKDAATKASGASPAAGEPSSGPPHPVSPGVDKDVASLQKLLACTPTDARGPCKVLATMAHCAAWNPVSPSGDGRYMGKGWVVQGTSIEERIVTLRSHTVPTGANLAWQLPVKIAFGEIPADAGPAFAQAPRAINAYERHDVPPAKNAAVDFLKETNDWRNDSKAVKTAGTMIETFSDSPAYLCQGLQQEVVLVEQGFGAEGKSADGLYARVWASSW